MVVDYDRLAKMFRPFADERELQLLYRLLQGEKCTNELAESTKIPQSTVSYHMNLLSNSGHVERRKDGKWTYYRISVKGVKMMKFVMEVLLEECDNFLKMQK